MIKKIKILIFILGIIFVLSCSNTDLHSLEIHKNNGDIIPLKVELADTPAKIQLGLMHRDELPANQGMLFIMPDENIHVFWMKDTKISLDIIFIFSDWKIAGIIENTVPYSHERLYINSPSKYVLEVNAGFAKKHGILPGDKVLLK